MADRLIDNLLNPINLYDAPFERNSIAVTLRYGRRNIFLIREVAYHLNFTHTNSLPIRELKDDKSQHF